MLLNCLMKKILFFTIGLWLIIFTNPALASPLGDNAVFYDAQGVDIARLQLLTGHSEATDKQAGESSRQEYIALQLDMAPNWKTYSNRENAGGLPPDIDDGLSRNLQKLEILFPRDKKFTFQGIPSYGYEGSVIFPVKVTRINPRQALGLDLQMKFLVCHIICVPATFHVVANVPPADNLAEPMNHTVNNPAIAAAIKKLPSDPSSLAIWSKVSWYMLLALIGGICLNIFPCVLPALSLKIHSLQQKTWKHGAQRGAQQDAKLIRQSIAITALGLFVFFVCLGWAIYGLRLLGKEFFWGQYFQSPWFLLALLLFFILTFFTSLKNLHIIENNSFFSFMPGSATLNRVLNFVMGRPLFRHSLAGDFLFGFIMAILSASCLAPFMSVSLTFALNQPQPLLVPLLVGVMGLGVALPWWGLALFPNILLSKGKVKNSDKKNPLRILLFFVLSILITLALLVIIIWILGLLKNYFGIWPYGLTFLLLLGLLGKSKPWTKNNFVLLVLAILLIGAYYQQPSTNKKNIPWEAFTATSLNPPITQPTLLVVTADWCLTCQVNTKMVFSSDRFLSWVKENNIRLLLADWTKPSREIETLLTNEHRVGIPLTIFYDTKGGKTILPELLSFDKFYDVIKTR